AERASVADVCRGRHRTQQLARYKIDHLHLVAEGRRLMQAQKLAIRREDRGKPERVRLIRLDYRHVREIRGIYEPYRTVDVAEHHQRVGARADRRRHRRTRAAWDAAALAVDHGRGLPQLIVRETERGDPRGSAPVRQHVEARAVLAERDRPPDRVGDLSAETGKRGVRI